MLSRQAANYNYLGSLNMFKQAYLNINLYAKMVSTLIPH